MDFFINNKNLLDCINRVSRSINGKTNDPILEGIYIEARKERVIFRATDTEIYISTSSVAVVKAKGNIIINGEILLDLVKKLPNGEVHMTIDKYKNKLKIECKKTQYKIMILTNNDFPQMPNIQNIETVLIKGKNLKECIKGTTFSIANNDIRPMLQGVLIQIKDKQIEFISSDGYRLSMKKAEIDHNVKEIKKALVSGKALNEINKLLVNDKLINIVITKNHLIFLTNDTLISITLLQKEYINYESMITKNFKIFIKLNRNEIINAIERTAFIGKSNKTNLISLEFEKNKIIIQSKSNIIVSKEEINAEISDKLNKMIFNYKYLIEALKNINEDYITLKINTESQPLAIEGENYLYIIIPSTRIYSNT